jgi:hypothetical protein
MAEAISKGAEMDPVDDARTPRAPFVPPVVEPLGELAVLTLDFSIPP